MKAMLEVPTFEYFRLELKHQGLAECRLTGIVNDELTPEKPRMEYRNYYLVCTALSKDGNIIRLKLKIGHCFIFEEDRLKELYEATVSKRDELMKLLVADGIDVREGEWR